MPLQLYNDLEDDVPELEKEIGFSGINNSLKATLLEGGTLAEGRNTILDQDGLIDTRPGMRIVCEITVWESDGVDGGAFYDTPQKECILVSAGMNCFEIRNTDTMQEPYMAADIYHEAGRKVFQQLVDKMYYTTTTGLHWVKWTGATPFPWVSGQVTAFKGGAAMPEMATIVAHNFRLFGVPKNSDTIYPSKILPDGVAADWDELQGIRVGTGSGDPIRRMIAGQDTNLYVLNEGSAWMIDTTENDSANWPIRKVTDKIGCAASQSAVAIGQDILFLSRIGVVNLGGLADRLSISPASAISGPIQATIDRINWAAAETATYATMWKHYYLLAVPVDGSTFANVVLAFNTITKRWVGEWVTANVQFTNPPGGWGVPIMTRFGGVDETLWSDIKGTIFKLDKSITYDEQTSFARIEIETHAKLRAWIFGSQECIKEPLWVELEFYKSTAKNVYAIAVCDEALAYPEVTLEKSNCVLTNCNGSNNPVIPHRVPLKLNRQYIRRERAHLRGKQTFREVSIKVVSKKGRLRLREVKMAAFLGTPKLI